MIRLVDVSKEFKTKDTMIKAADRINLEINDGEIFGIIGFSGAGKSTLVRCINLLERPTEGKVYLDDLELTSASKKELLKARRNIGMIFQQFNLLEQKSVIENICYPLLISGVRKKEAIIRSRQMLELVELTEKENSYPSQLSGGQKQRVAIARALATNPKYLLCDEATSALDPLTTKNILELLETINKKLGVTIVVITHELKVVEQICDRVAVMSNGKIEEEGKVEEIFLSPKSETGRKLVLPDSNTGAAPTRDYLRIVFDGQSSFEPVFANLISELGIKLNILGANTEDIGGKAYGQLLIERPDDQNVIKVRDYLNKTKVSFEEVFISKEVISA